MSMGARPPTQQGSAPRLPHRRRIRSRVLAAFVALPTVLLVWIILGARPAQAQATAPPAYSEDAVKAVFLYRFAGYVQWPMTDEQSRFVVAVLGDDEVAARLQGLLPNHPVHGLPAEVHRIHGLQNLGDAQMLYVGPGYDGDLALLTARLHGRPVLVVTDRDGALETGSMVNFLMQSGHVRFEVSLAAARQAGLIISSDLLAVAERVKTGDGRVPPRCAPLPAPRSGCAHRVAIR